MIRYDQLARSGTTIKWTLIFCLLHGEDYLNRPLIDTYIANLIDIWFYPEDSNATSISTALSLLTAKTFYLNCAVMSGPGQGKSTVI